MFVAMLALTALCGLFPASSGAEPETVEVDITFEGAYLPFEEYNFELMLPNRWFVFEADNPAIRFMAGTEDQGRLFWLEVYESGGEALETLAAALAASDQYANASEVSFNGVPFLRYDRPDINAFGALTVAGDSGFVYFFTFYPKDDAAFGALATQIMSSVRALE